MYRDPEDLEETRLLNTPQPEVLIKNLRKFETEWKGRKDNNGHCILNGDAIKEIKNIEAHTVRASLSGILPGCGMNRNECLNKHVNEFLSMNKIGVPLAYARCFKWFAQLTSMRERTAKKLNETSTECMETFAFEGDPEPNSTEMDTQKMEHQLCGRGKHRICINPCLMMRKMKYSQIIVIRTF